MRDTSAAAAPASAAVVAEAPSPAPEDEEHAGAVTAYASAIAAIAVAVRCPQNLIRRQVYRTTGFDTSRRHQHRTDYAESRPQNPAVGGRPRPYASLTIVGRR